MTARTTTALVAIAAMTFAGTPEIDASTWPQQTTFRDSAGIRIVENTRPPEDSRLDWRIGAEPLVSIGSTMGDEDPYLFTRVFGITRLSDGRIVIGDEGAKELRVFDQQGYHLETWGGYGEGPGEFGGNQLWGLARLPGDSIIVWHFWYPGMQAFGPDGEALRRFMPERAMWDTWDRRSHLWPLAVSRGGLVLAGQDDVYHDPGVVEVWDAAGKLRGSLGMHPGRELDRERDENDPDPVMLGYSVTRRPWGDQFIVGTNRRYEFRVFALDGSLARIVRLDYELRAPTRAHIDAEIARRAGSGESEFVVRRRREYREAPVAEYLPAYYYVDTDALDNLWVREYEAPGEDAPGRLWTIFDPDGRILGYFETPEGMGVYEIGEDYILGVTRDEMDVATVHMWSLER
ncbi:MAG: hypothetical protein OXI71_04540 [Gemmatimonadota bacterium]|nr:hypothetical protein [Gemmatimonadota bacterium]